MTDREISGILCINKPSGMTSHDVVNKIRRLYGTRKVGHTGTLDPMATGVLVVLIGKAAKLSDFLLADKKTYTAGLLLGKTTDTQDITGKIIESRPDSDLPDEDTVIGVCDSFIGKQFQTPPMYSAKKINGVKLYDLARSGTEIERQACEIEIYSIDVNKKSQNEYTLTVCCSKGTYIRTLCNDIGKRLGCGGCMSSLRRDMNGKFSLDNAVSLDKIASMSEEERDGLLISVESALSELNKVIFPPFFSRLAHCGCEIYEKKIGAAFPIGELIRVYDENGFFALGKVCEYSDGAAIKPIKFF
jgi:tRNA pseudouridine55 synthase